MKYNKYRDFYYIDNFKVSDEFIVKMRYIDDIWNWKEVNFNIEYSWVTDLYFNVAKKDTYLFYIVWFENKLITKEDYDFIKGIFWFSYDKKYFQEEIAWKMSFLQIEWGLTLYAIYENHE